MGEQLQLLGVPFMVCLSSIALRHRKPASSGTSRESCRSQGHDKRDTCTLPAFACWGWEGPWKHLV